MLDVNNNERIGDWIQTFTGKQFFTLDPHEDDVDIIDIAHALSNQCRYGGHSQKFYSVAEHCVHLSHVAPPELALSALMHDAAEAYLVDVPRPIKKSLKGYLDLESQLEKVIFKKFDLPHPNPPFVMQLDTQILMDERTQLMAVPPITWGTDSTMGPLGVKLEFWLPEIAEIKFINRFNELYTE